MLVEEKGRKDRNWPKGPKKEKKMRGRYQRYRESRRRASGRLREGITERQRVPKGHPGDVISGARGITHTSRSSFLHSPLLVSSFSNAQSRHGFLALTLAWFSSPPGPVRAAATGGTGVLVWKSPGRRDGHWRQGYGWGTSVSSNCKPQPGSVVCRSHVSLDFFLLGLHSVQL